MAATYPNIHAGPVEAYLSIYLGFVVVYAIIYVKQRRNLYVASRCPDMLIADLIGHSFMVSANSLSLIFAAHGRVFPCWVMKGALMTLAFGINMITTLRSMKLLWAFDKRFKWVLALGATAGRRICVLTLSGGLAMVWTLTLSYHGACLTLCKSHHNTNMCPWASDWMACWPFGVIWIPILESLAYGLGKAGADSEALGMRKEVAMGNQAVTACMVSSTALCMAMDLQWLDDVAFRPLPNIIALTMAAVHFVITHVAPSVYLGYGPEVLLRCSAKFSARPFVYNKLLPDLRRNLTKATIVPLDTPQPQAQMNSMDEEQAIGSTGELKRVVNPVRRPSKYRLEVERQQGEGRAESSLAGARPAGILTDEAMQQLLDDITHDEPRMLRVLDRARVLLVEDAMRFAVGLYVATHTPRTVDQREKIRTQCEGLLTKHFGKQAVYKLDVSSLAEARAVYEVTRLIRRKVLFEDDIAKALQSFGLARGELDLRLRQVAWDFVSEEAGSTGEQSPMAHSPRHASQEHRGSLISFDVPPRPESARGLNAEQEAASEPVVLDMLPSDAPPQQLQTVPPSSEDSASPADAIVSSKIGVLEQVQEGTPETAPQEKEEEHQGQAQTAEGGRTDDEPKPHEPQENQQPQWAHQHQMPQEQQQQEQQADLGQTKTPGGQEEGNTNFN